MSFEYPINSKSRQARLDEQDRPIAAKQVLRKPSQREGQNGDIAIGQTVNGIKLFVKIANKWYSFSPDNESKDERIYSASSFDSNRVITGSTSAADTTDILATLITDLIKVGIIKKSNQ